MSGLDDIDRRILEVLQGDGRISNQALAECVHLSPSACHRRVARLEADGIIAGYAARVDPAALGRATAVFVHVALERQNREGMDAFEAAVRACPDVLRCHLMSGDADYLLEVAARDMADYERIHTDHLARMPGVARMRSSFALRTVKREGVPNAG
jgi:Lrp/AsnC family leucine-responsive transcriptional regulator